MNSAIEFGVKNKVKTLQDLGEFGLIEKVRNWMGLSRPEVIRGIGDDVAVIEVDQKALLLTTDVLIEDIHFERSWTDPYRLGKKALAVNLSDIAAMAGIPKYFLITLGLPKTLPSSFVALFFRGVREMARRFQVDLVGGDTSLSQKIIINICLIGEGEKEALLFRNGAKIGDDLYVSGTLGDAALGLKILQNKRTSKKPKGLIEKHLAPTPRIELGQALGKQKIATAMIDVSDGLLGDALHLSEESKVGVRIWGDCIPLSILFRRWVGDYSKDPYQIALSGGEDYELLFTASPKRKAAVQSLSSSFNVPITRVGKILPQKDGFQFIGKGGKEVTLNRLGFDHFK